MPSPSADAELWRDYDPVARRLPGMSLGSRALGAPAGDVVTALHTEGVRCLRLPEPVRLCADAPAAVAHALRLVREATGRGLAVLWDADCDDGCAGRRLYDHLYPPRQVHGAPADTAERWRATYFPAKCVYRRGPGFVEVRDRRFGTLELITVDEAAHLDSLDALTEGVPTGQLPDAVRRDFADAALTAEHAGRTWWLPTRVRRWPFPSLTV
ncbi:hypothetical protein OK074_1853 [Actinobacteria bacterium OK074]|nr:hypothetical protein OK074_1853 [Actinobacteria bacterium OK074]